MSSFINVSISFTSIAGPRGWFLFIVNMWKRCFLFIYTLFAGLNACWLTRDQTSWSTWPATVGTASSSSRSFFLFIKQTNILATSHGLFNYICAKAKCRNLKHVLCGRCLSAWGPLPSYDPSPPPPLSHCVPVRVYCLCTYSYREGSRRKS